MTLIPSGLSSSFIHTTIFSRAAFVDPYTPRVQLGYCAVTDEMMQILAPAPAARISSIHSLMRKKVLLTFKSHILS